MHNLPGSKKLLEFRDLTKTYGKRHIFSGITLCLEPGTTVGITGPSGCGKSTLLKIAAGLVQPDKGTAMIRTRRVGYVFQEPRLLPWYSARDNIALPLHPLGWSVKEARLRAEALMETMGLAGFEHHYPEALSGGMKQRVSICRAIAIEPELLLLDEPFTGLDPDLRVAVKNRLEKVLTKTCTTVIHVTHDTAELLSSTAAIYHLGAGGIMSRIHQY